MILLKLLLIVVGILFLVFGILITFFKKYSLINYYEKKQNLIGFIQNGKWIGIIEFSIGLIMIIFGSISFFLPNIITVIGFISIIISFFIALAINELVFYKKNKVNQK